MADEDNQNIAGKYLPNILGLLGVLTSSSALRNLRNWNGPRPMHPAVAKELGFEGPLTSRLARQTQQGLDDYVMQNYDKLKKTPFNDQNELHYKYGWQFSPVMGFAPEYADTGMNINKATGNIVHPGGDMLRALNVSRSEWKPMEHTQYGKPLGGLFDDPNNPGKTILQMNEDLRLPMSEFQKSYPLAYSYAGKYMNDYPWNRITQGVAAHELQHAAQEEVGKPYPFNQGYNNLHESEAYNTGFRAMNPEAYQYPFRSTMHNSNYSNFRTILDQLGQD